MKLPSNLQSNYLLLDLTHANDCNGLKASVKRQICLHVKGRISQKRKRSQASKPMGRNVCSDDRVAKGRKVGHKSIDCYMR